MSWNYCYRDWREKQQEEIRTRDETSKLRREQTIDEAERAIEDFYENYSKKKERNIRDNKCGLFLSFFLGLEADDHPANSETQKRNTLASFLPPFRRGLHGSVSAASLIFRTHRARQLPGQVLVQLIWQDLRKFC